MSHHRADMAAHAVHVAGGAGMQPARLAWRPVQGVQGLKAVAHAVGPRAAHVGLYSPPSPKVSRTRSWAARRTCRFLSNPKSRGISRAQLGRAPRLNGNAARLLTQRASLALLAAGLPGLAPEHRARMCALWQQPSPPPAARAAARKAPGTGAENIGNPSKGPEPAGAAEAALAAPVLRVVQGLADKSVAAATGAEEPANGGLQGAHVGGRGSAAPQGEAPGGSATAEPGNRLLQVANGFGCSSAAPQGEVLGGCADSGAGCVQASDRAVYAALARGYVWKLEVFPGATP